MKIIELHAENVKRLKAVQIRPTGHLVEIAGRNGQGKSSVLDCIWWALAGGDTIQRSPIRKGESEAVIRLDLGDIKVRRTFKRKGDGDEFTTSLIVENGEGARYSSPQKMLDALVDHLSFDPLAFTRMKARDQFDALRAFVPGIDFDAIDRANKADFDARTVKNREVASLTARYQAVSHSGRRTGRARRRHCRPRRRDGAAPASTTRTLSGGRRGGSRPRPKSPSFRTKAKAQLRASGRLAPPSQYGRSGRSERRIPPLARCAPNSPLRLPCLPRSTPPRSATKIADAGRDQRRLRHRSLAPRTSATEIAAEGEAAEAEATRLTKAMEARNAAKAKAISAAKMPVPGLEFGEGEILLNGLPFDQGSDAERLRTSIAIAMAANPKLRVIRVRDGSLLDDDAMKLLGEMAETSDMQVWVEVIQTGRRSLSSWKTAWSRLLRQRNDQRCHGS